MWRALLVVLALACACATPRTARHALVLETTRGAIRCNLEAPRAPRATAMIVDLTARRRFYDGLPFFRAIPRVLVQTGSPAGDGSGPLDRRLPVEPAPDDAARLARPGTLFLARYTPPPGRVDPHPPSGPIGTQLVVGLVDMRHLAGTVTVLGACRDLDVVARVADDTAAHVQVRVVRATVR